MNFQPKKRKYRLSFRNKTFQSSYILPIDKRLRQLQNSQLFKNGLPASVLRSEKENLIEKQQASDRSPKVASFFGGGPAPLICDFPFGTFEQEGARFTYRVSTIQVVNKDSTFEKRFDNHQKISQESALHEKKTPLLLTPLSFVFKSLFPKYKIGKSGAEAMNRSPKDTPPSPRNGSSPELTSPTPLEDLRPASLLSNQLLPRMQTLDKVRFGNSGIFFCHSGTVSAKFLETTRLAVARKLKKAGRFWIRICADTPVTARSAETRMGRGKGAISHYEGKIRPGQMFLEFSGISKEMVKSIFQELAKKTPITIKLVA